jgi:hypothetical protein
MILAKGLIWRYILRPPPAFSDQPHLSNAAAEKWHSDVAESKVMVEYGAGGSTLAAIRHVSLLVSVDTDKRFLKAVERGVSAIADRGAFHPVHANIGLTWHWGMPVIVAPSPTRLEKWRKYPIAPWLALEGLGEVPDLIFIDGRFRVACVLESFLMLPAGAECKFLMDDFVGREDVYGCILEFVKDVKEHDRMISFRRKDSFDRHRCSALLETYYGDYR